MCDLGICKAAAGLDLGLLRGEGGAGEGGGGIGGGGGGGERE